MLYIFFPFRCGEIFCNRCTSYTQRLSLLAQRDPDGALYKVTVIFQFAAIQIKSGVNWLSKIMYVFVIS